MRILIITEASSAGVGRHVMDLARGLLRRGHDTHLGYSERRMDSIFRNDLEELSALRRVRIDMRRGPHPQDLGALRNLYRYVEQHGPFDVIHAQSSKAGALARFPWPRLGRGVFYTPHCIYTMNPNVSRSSFLFYRTVELALVQSCDRVVAVSPDERDHMVGLGFPPDKVEFIPNGVDGWSMPSKRALRHVLGLSSEPTIGFIGRFDAQKDPLHMIDAFALACRTTPRLRLAMVGDGPLLGKAQARAAELGVNERIRWLGFRPARDVLPAFDLLALTSRYEGLPYVLLEALVAGVPVVSTPVGGAKLLVGSTGCGFVTASHSASELAASAVELLESRERHQQASAAARARGAQYSVDAMVDRTLEMYCSVIESEQERTSA